MKVKFFSERIKGKKITAKIQNKVKNILKTGQYTNSKFVNKFEKLFRKNFQTKYCVAVNNGTSALHLSLIALNIKPGDEIIVPSMTFIASAAAIEYVGAKPVFVDVNYDDWLINTDLIAKKINKKTKAIMVVHLHGLMCDMDKIKIIAKKYKLKIIEDSAQAHGSTFKNKNPGYFSDVATFSFYPTKNLGAVGEGGAILTNNLSIYKKTKRMRTWSHKKHNFYEISFNYRMSEFSAVSLIEKLKYLKNDVNRRIEIAKLYKKKLNHKNFSKYNSKIKKHSYHIFAVTVKSNRRNKIINTLKKIGIDTNIHYPYSLSKLKVFKFKNNSDNTPVSNRISKEFISLPIYPEIKDKQISFTCKNLNKLLTK